jgi:phosphopantetheinyl transferase (holo-ACP synthase)
MARILKFCSVAFALKGNAVELLREFLESLLNRQIQDTETIRLTSAQTARVAMWAGKNQIFLDLKQIRNSFQLSSLNLEFSDSKGGNSHRRVARASKKSGTIAIGNDIQLIAELFPYDESLDSLNLEKVFTKYEIAYSNSTDNPRVTLAGLFSLKESLVKAGATYSTYLDIEITHDNYGAPIFFGFLVSISHSGDYASSVALKIC